MRRRTYSKKLGILIGVAVGIGVGAGADGGAICTAMLTAGEGCLGSGKVGC